MKLDRLRVLLLVIILTPPFLLLMADSAKAYVGPGAGFALVTSFLVVFGALALAGVYLSTWPIRLGWRFIVGRHAFRHARVKRVIVLGLDGIDAGLAQQWMEEGKLPNMAKLHFRELGTTLPALSPVAWSTFQTGLAPAGHGLFDFLRPARPSYSAELSSVTTTMPPRSLTLGRFKLPIGKPRVRIRRRGVPFWKILGQHGIFSSVIRVPISFPPEKFNGVALSAMCVPDLRGTQGSFTFFTDEGNASASEGGIRVPVERRGDTIRCRLTGPPNPISKEAEELSVAVDVKVDGSGGASVTVQGDTARLEKGKHTEWMPVIFRPGMGVKIKGVVRFCLIDTEPFKLYASPIHFDPQKPAQPISQPNVFSVYLGKRQGAFATLGLAEDTWALNERVIDENMFLDGTYRIHAERELMFFDALDKVRKGLVVCVFDGSDRIQHMFFRTLADDHPANRDKETEAHAGVIEDMYKRMDDLVGRTAAELKEGDCLLVMSDHGFAQFKRGINWNAWLREHGWLVMKEGEAGGPWYDGVDWEKTRAYGLGLAGVFVNLEGRESMGTVDPAEARELKNAIKARMLELRDPERPDATPILKVYDSQDLLGPYKDEAPDLLIGYGHGYRVSWTGATGHTESDEVFEDNTKSWSGDHCVDPSLVPGILLSTLEPEVERPHIKDLAPTVLSLFGVKAPATMKGPPIFGGVPE